MAYLLDSDVMIDYLAGDPDVRHLIGRLTSSGLAISAITYMEVYQGTLGSPDPGRAQAKLETLVDSVPVVPVSAAIARRCAELRTHLQQQNKRVRPRALDLLIAATALEHRLTLVTRNLADYDDIPELSLATTS